MFTNKRHKCTLAIPKIIQPNFGSLLKKSAGIKCVKVSSVARVGAMGYLQTPPPPAETTEHKIEWSFIILCGKF